MAIGDDALAAGMQLVPGTALANTIDTEINRSRDYIAQRTHDLLPVAKGGTGATTATAARANLGAVDIAQVSTDGNTAPPGKIPIYNPSGQLTAAQPTLADHVVTVRYLNGHTPPQQLTDGGTFLRAEGKNLGTTGDLFAGGTVFVNTGPAASDYTVAYIDGTGALRKGASSERYKKHISEADPLSLGDVWPNLTRYQMRSGDGSWKYGYIAERLDESDDLRPFVVRDQDGRADSIDFIALLIVQNAQLHQAVTLLAQRILTLEDRHG